MSVSLVSGLRAIAPEFDAVVCDVWGVLHDGARPYPGASEALAEFRRARGPVVLLSNAPRPHPAVEAHLRHLGVGEAWDGVVTSGDVTRGELAARAPLAVLHVGPERDAPLMEGLDVRRTGVERAELVLCSGLYDDETETPDDYADLLAAARARALPMICANPDLRVQRGDKIIWCAGALAQAYEALGGRVLYAGKPHAPAFARARLALEERAGRPLDPRRILVVGDGLLTDIEGARRAGFGALLVTGGVHAEEFGGAGAPSERRIAATLERHALSVRAALPRLVW